MKRKSRKKISAIIACYNDSKAIPIMHAKLTKTFLSIGCNYEIIFVNDGSKDNSENVLTTLCKKDKKTIAVFHSRNFNSQNAFTSGIDIATGDAVVLLDGDLQDPPEVIEKFYKKWIDGYDVVYGKRTKREVSYLLGFFYKLFYRLFNKLSYVEVPHDAGDFSLMDKKVYLVIKKFPEKDRFIRGLRAWSGFKQIGVEYFRPERKFGKSTNNFFKNFRWARKGIFSFSYIPLEVITYFAVIMMFLSVIGMIFYFIAYLLNPTPQGFTTIYLLILILGSLQLLSFSILSEYIGKIFEETKNRPKYIVKKYINYKKRKN